MTVSIVNNKFIQAAAFFAVVFAAFFMFGFDKYEKDNKTMDQFLLEAIENINDSNAITDERLDIITESFDRGLLNAYAIFGKSAFRKFSQAQNPKSQFNRALFESWTVELAKIEKPLSDEDKDNILNGAKEEMLKNSDYINSISQSTSDSRNVKMRFEITSNIISKAIR